MFLMFLMLVGGALAMSEPVVVKSTPGDWIKIYAWPAESGQLLGLGDGIADEDGYFNKTFFSLSVPDVKFTIFVIRDKEKIIEADFLDHDISEALNIECKGSSCEIVSDGFVEVVNETVNETVNEIVVVVNDSVVESDSPGIVATGKAIFTKGDGSVNWTYSVGGFVVCLFLLVFLVAVSRRGKSEKVVLSDDEKELRDVEGRVKETSEKIKKMKDDRDRKANLEKAKEKLDREEAELKRLENGGDEDKVEKQEEVVEDAENVVKKDDD